MKQIVYTMMLIMSLGAYAQENNQTSSPIDEASRLLKSIESLNREIPMLENELQSLKMSWYQSCVDYLKSGSIDEDILNNIIEATHEDIDGKSLLDELKRAQACKKNNVAYVYNEVPSPLNQGGGNSKNRHSNRIKDEKQTKPKTSQSSEQPIVTKPVSDEDHLKQDNLDTTPPVEAVVVDKPITSEEPPIRAEKKSDNPKDAPKENSSKSDKKENNGRGDIGTIKKTTKKDGTN